MYTLIVIIVYEYVLQFYASWNVGLHGDVVSMTVD